MKARHRRFAWIFAGVMAIAVAVTLVLNAFRTNLVFFFTPTEIAEGKAPTGRSFRVGGLVEVGRGQRRSGNLPAPMFLSQRGVVAQGSLQADGSFRASEVLAKHDENYMPPEAAEALKRAGHPVGAPEQFRQPPKP